MVWWLIVLLCIACVVVGGIGMIVLLNYAFLRSGIGGWR